ncbi:MAG: hypothetical protein J6I66_10490 [Lachnospiraceae bacterium]|nr:hypothetical protein [Lachnospiraceae bacterium]MBP3755274.1 hypothetical protein [Lachnospiraceae bacterium]
MKIPKIFEIKDTGEKLDPGKLAIAALIISALVIVLVIWSKNGYYNTRFSEGAFSDETALLMRKIISIGLSVLPSVLMVVFHGFFKITNKTTKALTILLIVTAVLICANGIFEAVSLAHSYVTEDKLRTDLCFVLIGCHILSAGSASNGLKILKIQPPA